MVGQNNLTPEQGSGTYSLSRMQAVSTMSVSMSVRMSKERTKRKFSQEFKENAVQLCLARSTTVRQIAAELGELGL